MIDVIIKLSFIYFIIITIKYIFDVQKFNQEASLIKVEDITTIDENKNILDPLLINYPIEKNIDLQTIIEKYPNRYYIENDKMIRINDFIINKDISIYKNSKLFELFDINYLCDVLYNRFKIFYSSNNIYSISLFQGINKTGITKNKSNMYLIGCLSGECIIYLYNPKHVDYLKNKNTKKWAINIEISKDKLLYIPTNWYYNIETESECILFHINADTYFTSLYNNYRN